eukprot:CAMPEP_0201721588 /NCGR_PEP_ID=MMETSP0593-20130828/6228_1 /ASSEMBLY_ACC=CAM_ASM_000672 /TAXON_ID=267983 /ORGANISM="Skeletonema japonicum, Strain CCMP2506" /LENGTH=305 /DNA_ID=CAMNT_0048212425 /DNA_START=983 /DNA_END=1900 /DNA_ORIENTATION=-
MEGLEESKALESDFEGIEENRIVDYDTSLNLEPDFEGIEENRKVNFNIILPNFNLNDPTASDILYHPHPAPYGFFSCLAVLLRDVFYFMCFGSGSTKYATNDNGDVEITDTTDSREDNAIHSRSDQFWVKHGIDVYTRDAHQAPRLQVPARIVFTNEKLIGPPPAQGNDSIVYQRPGRRTMSFNKQDGTPLSNSKVEEPLRHTLIRQRNRKNKSVQSPIPINEIICRYDELPINDDNETVANNDIKYEDVVKESRSLGLFGSKPTNLPPALDVDANTKIDEERRGQKDLPEKEYESNKREREIWF